MLNRIVAEIRDKVARDKTISPLDLSSIQPGSFRLSQAIKAAPWSLIAECKLTSPAKGRLCSDRSVSDLARIFTAHGAAALSVHTSGAFQGNIGDIASVKAVSPLPIMRKDFIVDEYQIYEARAVGADAILLIAAILSDGELEHFLRLSASLGLDALVEVHSQAELARVQRTTAELIGINNRDLTNFTTSVETTFRLLPHCDPDRLLISESGIDKTEDAYRLKAAGIRGILVGEALVKSPDIGQKTRKLSLSDQRMEE